MEEIELLKLENVSYEFEKGKFLENISFSLKKGERIVIFGPENSGLDVICPVIAGIIRGYHGNIYYKGRSIKSFDYVETHNYRKEIGYLQSDFGLINNMTVFENISLPLKYHSQLSSREIEKIVDDYIKELNLVHCRDLRPVHLTKSEKLKAAYIRAIVFNPDLLLIEQSLAGQALINVQTFFKSLKNNMILKSKSVIFITYNPQLFFDLSDRFMMFYNGNIVFQGLKTDFLLKNNPYLQQYLDYTLEGPMLIQ